jgi:tetratricopeptide (TPR) repeat protein
LPAWLFVLSLLPLAWWLRKRRPLTSLGLGWFLCAHVLTASFVPLDLMYEHRNYFASLGICMVLADWLLLAPDSEPRRRLGMLVAVCFLSFLALTTYLRAREWTDPLRFAETEAAKHPRSPRATYELARMLIIRGHYDPASPFTRRAWPALEQAMQVPGSNALPAQAALMLAARTGQPMQHAWWEKMREALARHPGAPENQLSLIAMTHCSNLGLCHFPVDEMVATFNAGLEQDNAGILAIFGNYARNTMGDQEFALRLWRESARLQPRNAQFQLNLALIEMEMGRYDESEAAIDRADAAGRFGQYSPQARQMRVELERRRRASQAPR